MEGGRRGWGCGWREGEVTGFGVIFSVILWLVNSKSSYAYFVVHI